jgi:hypothetical protein
MKVHPLSLNFTHAMHSHWTKLITHQHRKYADPYRLSYSTSSFQKPASFVHIRCINHDSQEVVLHRGQSLEVLIQIAHRLLHPEV